MSKRPRQNCQVGDTPFDRKRYSPMSAEADDKEATEMKGLDVAELLLAQLRT